MPCKDSLSLPLRVLGFGSTSEEERGEEEFVLEVNGFRGVNVRYPVCKRIDTWERAGAKRRTIHIVPACCELSNKGCFPTLTRSNTQQKGTVGWDVCDVMRVCARAYRNEGWDWLNTLERSSKIAGNPWETISCDGLTTRMSKRLPMHYFVQRGLLSTTRVLRFSRWICKKVRIILYLREKTMRRAIARTKVAGSLVSWLLPILRDTNFFKRLQISTHDLGIVMRCKG